MIKTERFEYFDNDGRFRAVQQVWALIPATGVWIVVSTLSIKVDVSQVPACPTR